jgi:hypothetical protein
VCIGLGSQPVWIVDRQMADHMQFGPENRPGRHGLGRRCLHDGQLILQHRDQCRLLQSESLRFGVELTLPFCKASLLRNFRRYFRSHQFRSRLFRGSYVRSR